MFCMASLPWSAPKGVVLLNYVDDFLILAQGPEELGVAVKELITAVGELPGGTFKLVLKSKAKVTTGVEFLGHRLTLQSDGTLSISVSHANLEDFWTRLSSLEEKLGPAGFVPGKPNVAKVKKLLAQMIAFANGWKSNFVLCDEAADWHDQAINQVAEIAAKFGLAMSELEMLAAQCKGYAPSDYTFGK